MLLISLKRTICEEQTNGKHVETVVCLGKKNAKPNDYVEIGVDAEDYHRIKDGGMI